MDWEFNNNKPIHNQLVEILTLYIITGGYKLGEKIPSVRDLANEAKVNPNTMQKALLELEDNKLIVTKRTSGKYVTNDEKLILSLKEKLVSENIEEFLIKMKYLGVSLNELIKYMKEME